MNILKVLTESAKILICERYGKEVAMKFKIGGIWSCQVKNNGPGIDNKEISEQSHHIYSMRSWGME